MPDCRQGTPPCKSELCFALSIAHQEAFVMNHDLHILIWLKSADDGRQ